MVTLDLNTTQAKQILDITDQVSNTLKKNKFRTGLCYLFVKHTTCALTTADLDPGTDLDYLDAFNQLVPKLEYRHPHDPTHFGDHLLASLIGSSITLPVENNQLVLGTWQRAVLVELNGPRQRQLTINFLLSSSR